MSNRILVVEDDPAVAQVLRDYLTLEGYVVDNAADGIEALAKATALSPDVMLLDVVLPSVDGFEVCRALSRTNPRTAVVIMTARCQPEDKIRGLNLGADDYVTKPFTLEELLARIHAVLRRTRPSIGRIQLGDVTIDFIGQHASRGHSSLTLTMREFELLHYMAERQGKVSTREELLRNVWGYRDTTLTRTIDNFIARLRRKIERDPRHPSHIRTAHGDGYCLIL